MTDHLRRELAPISDAGWEQIRGSDPYPQALPRRPGPGGVRRTEGLGPLLGIRRPGPRRGLHLPGEGVVAGIREPQPLVELRTPFELSISELDRAERGAQDPDLDALIDAARRAAIAEDTLVFDGYASAGVAGIGPASPHDPLTIPENYDHYPRAVARAVAALRREGVGGPYTIALGPRCYTGVIETSEHGG